MSAHRFAGLTIIALYWATLILGMASCIAIRTDATVVSIWTGTVAGTVLGHALALCNIRTRFAILVIMITAILFGPHVPAGITSSTCTLAFLPAAACAFWSLGDRTGLVAYWFPVVIWMLSILEHAGATAIPDHAGVALLALLAVLFVVFLRARETRRVALWCAVAATPLAQARRNVTLKEPPGPRLAQTAWTLVASAIALGATVWIAPRLWQPETLSGRHEQVEAQHAHAGLPCCPARTEVETTRTRVKEYFDAGRARETGAPPRRPGIDCARCEGGTGTYVVDGESGGFAGAPATTYDPWSYDAPGYVIHRSYQPPAGDPQAFDRADPAQVAPPSQTGAGTDVAAPSQSVEVPPQIVAPPAQPSPVVVSPPKDIAQAPPAPSPPSATSPPLPQPDHGVARDVSAGSVAPAATTAPPQSSPAVGSSSILPWVALLVVGGILFQLAKLVLRPLRRLVTLRHLRRPFWEETVDQRVSNAWQLALVGLRDAGWRTTLHESPQQLARRVGVAGVDRCAAILERARHGIGIDAGDLETMTESADTAYHAARHKVGAIARATSWLRWPLT